MITQDKPTMHYVKHILFTIALSGCLSAQGNDKASDSQQLQALLQPIVELEGALRAQAELESAATQLFSADEEAIPDAYRELVEQYYRTLSEGDSGGAR